MEVNRVRRMERVLDVRAAWFEKKDDICSRPSVCDDDSDDSDGSDDSGDNPPADS